MEAEGLFVQEVVHLRSGQKIDLAFIQEVTFVETMDLSGPQLMMDVDDPNAWLRDFIGLKNGDKISITMADMYVRDNGISDLIEFTVLSFPVEGQTVSINAMATKISDIKKRSVSAMVFNRKSPNLIINKLFPGLKYDIDKSPIIEDYHMLAGESPSYMLRQMTREQGAHLYMSRDTMCFKRLVDLMKKPADFIYHHDDEREENQIIDYTVPSTQHILEDQLFRRYSGWSMTKGWVSVGDKTLPCIVSSSQSALTLKNITAAPKPTLDFTCMGNGGLRAGSCIDLIWHTNNIEAPIDESLPKRVIASVVSHFYASNKYYCRVKGVVPLEKNVIDSPIKVVSESASLPNTSSTSSSAPSPGGSVSSDHVMQDDEIIADDAIMM